MKEYPASVKLVGYFWYYMAIIQLDFFKSEEESEIEALRGEIEAVKKSSDRVRKGTYARIGEMNKIVLDLQSRLAIIEHHICHGANNGSGFSS